MVACINFLLKDFLGTFYPTLPCFCKHEKNRFVYGAMAQWLGHWIPNPGFLASRFTQTFILLRLIRLIPGIPGNLVVKNKLSPQSSLAALRQLNPLQRGHKFFLKVLVIVELFISLAPFYSIFE